MNAAASMPAIASNTLRNVESEAAIIGALLIDNRSIDRTADRLSPDDFSEALHGRIYSAIVREASLGRAANPVTLRPYLTDDPALKELGGVGYLVQLTASTAAVIMLDTCVGQVIDMAKRRRMIERLTAATQLAADLDASDVEVVEAADAAVSCLSDTGDGVVQITAGRAATEMLDAFDTDTPGVTCGRISRIDGALGPIRRHHLVIAGGRPGMGKTAFAISYALGAASRGHGVLFISLEMNRIELMQRATADLLFDGREGVPYEHIRDGRFQNTFDRDRVYRAARQFAELPFHIVDASSLTIGRLNSIVRRTARRMKAAGKVLELVIVDYLQLVRPDHRCSPYEAVSEVSRGLKALAKQNDLGVLALAQLSREVEKRDNKRPVLSDLRDSGQIEQDADAIVFLYREEYYLRAGMPDKGSAAFETVQAALEVVRDEIELIVAKRRNGTTGRVKARFCGAYQAVRDMAA
ncbi:MULTISPECIES: replicative DNA helicase [unclassified Sphingobium]|uniref:replicative DNA helicase n=1 Tax=unclassified Sphingobium TaxID=2611147 RepID=UPI00119A131B|nr:MULTISPECIES: DnaB-like helicase C-terminal domain-containing protein [unclassified Sphingobium]TWD09799.1 replicative DNA helicase [Sphingobium sp. AEW010]TWD26470.1 replicative DNA helicase [Sphingobium sp. AEW013]TWD27761.1 replicative DNA helicase [Sphingobium sp. AEW001]